MEIVFVGLNIAEPLTIFHFHYCIEDYDNDWRIMYFKVLFDKKMLVGDF